MTAALRSAARRAAARMAAVAPRSGEDVCPECGEPEAYWTVRHSAAGRLMTLDCHACGHQEEDFDPDD